MGNKLCECLKPKPTSSEKPYLDTEMKELSQNLRISPPKPSHKRDQSRPVLSKQAPEPIPLLDIEEIKEIITKIPLLLQSPLHLHMRHSIKKPLTLKMAVKDLRSQKESMQLPILEEKEEFQLMTPLKGKSKPKTKKISKKGLKNLKNKKMFMDTPATSAMKDLRTYAFSPSLESDILIYANNVSLETAESLWALNTDMYYKHINLTEYEVINYEHNDSSYKLQNKITLSFLKLKVIEFPAENPLNLASFYSQARILEKLNKIKYFNNFFCKLESIYIIEASEAFPLPKYSFKAIKLQNYGLCSVQDLIAHGYQFQPTQVLSFLKNIAGFCAKAEELGIANRKLIPMNFFLAEGLAYFRVYDFSLACDISEEKLTKIKYWPPGFEEFLAPEVVEILGSEQFGTYNPFLSDVFTLGLTVLFMLGVKKEEINLLKAKESALENRLKTLEEQGYGEIVKCLRGMLREKPQDRLKFKEIFESLKDFKKKNTFIGNLEVIDKLKEEEKIKDCVFFEKLGDLLFLVKGPGESLLAYEEAMNLFFNSFLQTKNSHNIEIRIYEKIIKANYQIENYSEAIKYHSKVCDVLKDIPNEHKIIENINNLIIMAQLKTSQRHYNLAAKLFFEAYTTCGEYFQKQENHMEFARLFKGFGEMLVKINGFEELGMKYLHRAWEIIMKMEGIKSQNYFLYLDNEAEHFERINAIKNATQTYQRVVDEGRVCYGQVHPLLSKMFIKLSNAYYNHEEYYKAIGYYKRALKLQFSVFGEKSLEFAITKLQLAKNYLSIKNWKKALKRLNESLDVTKKILGDDTREVALILNAIGQAYSLKPNFQLALENFNEAYEILRDIYHKDVLVYIEMGHFLEDIGTLYALQHDKGKALSYFYQGLLMRKEIYGDYSIEVALAYERIGDFHLDFDDGYSALDTYKSALEIYKMHEAKNYMGAIRLLEHVGKLTIMESEFEKNNQKEDLFKKGMEYLLQCVELQEKYLTKNTEEEMEWKKSMLNYIGNVFFQKIQYVEAENFMKKALETINNFYKNPTEESADILVNLAVIYYKQNKPEQALEFAQKSFEINSNIYGENDPLLAKNLHILIRIHKELKDNENANKYELWLENIKKSGKVNEEDMKTGLIQFIKKKNPNHMRYHSIQ